MSSPPVLPDRLATGGHLSGAAATALDRALGRALADLPPAPPQPAAPADLAPQPGAPQADRLLRRPPRPDAGPPPDAAPPGAAPAVEPLRTAPPPDAAPAPAGPPALRRVAAAVKHGLALAAHRSGALAVLRAAGRLPGRRRVRVYGYHRVVPDAVAAARATMPPMSISTGTFALHLDHLARHYAVWPLERAAAALEGAARFPDRDVAVITFDDGYRDVLAHAAPMLRARGLPATLFVSSGDLGGRPLLHDRVYALLRRAARARLRLLALPAPPAARWPLARAEAALDAGAPLDAADAILFALPRPVVEALAGRLAARVGEPSGDEVPPTLTWEEAGALGRFGIEVAAHGETHAHLPLEEDPDLERELAGPRDELARRLDRAFAALAYPAGRYDRRVVDAARRAGYRVAVTTEARPNRPGDDLLRLGRQVLSEAHARGLGRDPSPALVAAHLDDLFGLLGGARPERGDRRVEEPWLA